MDVCITQIKAMNPVQELSFDRVGWGWGSTPRWTYTNDSYSTGTGLNKNRAHRVLGESAPGAIAY